MLEENNQDNRPLELSLLEHWDTGWSLKGLGFFLESLYIHREVHGMVMVVGPLTFIRKVDWNEGHLEQLHMNNDW